MHCCKPHWVHIFCVLLQVGLLAQGLLAQGVLAQTTLRPTVDRVTAGLFDTDRKRIVLATEKTLHILSADELLASATGQSAQKGISIELELSQITALDLSSDSKSLLIAGGDPGQSGCVECLDWPSARLRKRIETCKDGSPIADVVTDVHWFPSGQRWIESHWSGDVLIREQDGTQVSRFTGHTGIVLSAIPWNDQFAASCGIDQTIKIWRIADGELVRSLDNHTSAVTKLLRWSSPQGKPLLISMGRDRTLRLWDPLIGRLIRFVKLQSIPVAIAFEDPESLMVLEDNGKVSKVSLPLLEIEDSKSSEVSNGTTMIQIAPGVWKYW